MTTCRAAVDENAHAPKCLGATRCLARPVDLWLVAGYFPTDFPSSSLSWSIFCTVPILRISSLFVTLLSSRSYLLRAASFSTNRTTFKRSLLLHLSTHARLSKCLLRSPSSTNHFDLPLADTRVITNAAHQTLVIDRIQDECRFGPSPPSIVPEEPPFYFHHYSSPTLATDFISLSINVNGRARAFSISPVFLFVSKLTLWVTNVRFRVKLFDQCSTLIRVSVWENFFVIITIKNFY